MSTVWDVKNREPYHLLYSVAAIPIDTASGAARITDSIDTNGYWLPLVEYTVSGILGSTPSLRVDWQASNDNVNWYDIADVDMDAVITTDSTVFLAGADDITHARWHRINSSTNSGTITAGTAEILFYMRRLK